MSEPTRTDSVFARRVLVVEDDAGLRDLIAKALRKAGFEVACVSSGAEAIEGIAADPSRVLLLDQKLPDMSGREIITALAGSGIHVPFVMMTGHGDERLAVDMMKQGAADYLLKDPDLIDRLPVVMARVFRTIETERDLLVAEQALQESEQIYRNLFQNVPTVAVQGYGLNGITRYWNRASELLYGYSSGEVIGKNLLDLIIPPEMRAPVAQAMRHMAETGQAIPSAELQLLRKDGSPVAVFSSHVIIQIPGRAPELFCIDLDLTERKRAAAERESLQNQLNQAQKMESIGRLAGGVAHDFNNMLHVILGTVELASEKAGADSALQADLEEIRSVAQRSANLTRQLLAFARKQTIAPRVLDLNETLAGTLQMLRRLIGENVDLAWRPEANLWAVKIDPSQIDQLLANLCLNARDAIDGHGTISLATGAAVFDAAACARHEGAQPGDYVRVSVADNGSGMDEETRLHIFEPFFTTKGVGEGTGLGLATVYGIVVQNGGIIDVQSEKGRGTTVSVYLPRHRAKADLPLGTEAVQAHARGHETILLVEDEPSILQMTRRLLERHGYTVLAAATPGEALRKAREHPGEIHLLMTDVVMPEMNGRDLARTLLGLYPDVKRLFMSGYTADIIAHHGVLEEGVCFIQKPFSMKALDAKIREALDAQTPGET